MLIVGIDGGGTKTEAVLCDEKGNVIKRVKGGPSSPTGQTPAIAAANIKEVMTCLMAEHGGLNGNIDALFAGLSGGGVGNNVQVMRDLLLPMLPGCIRLKNYNDAVTALRCVIPDGDGLIAISGTGSSIFSCVDEELHQVGGWGYLLGDEGSGFDLGKRALKSALRDTDGRGKSTALTAACEKKLGMPVHAAIPALYAEPRKNIADFAPVLLTEAENGDEVALTEMKESAASMAEAIVTAASYIPAVQKKVAVAGSIWKNTLYRRTVQNLLGENYVLRSSDLPPVYGCIVLALKLAGIRAAQETEDAFRATLPPAVQI